MIVGIDEAGIGCWAGDLVLVAAAFDSEEALAKSGFRDSKFLREKKRDELADAVLSMARWIFIKNVSPEAIDGAAHVWEAWRMALTDLISECRNLTDGLIVVDGERRGLPLMDGVLFEIKADANRPMVSAASIIAKYCQVMGMKELDEKYPDYNFAGHKGYGTQFHQRALNMYGPVEAHRLSYRPVQKVFDGLTTNQKYKIMKKRREPVTTTFHINCMDHKCETLPSPCAGLTQIGRAHV